MNKKIMMTLLSISMITGLVSGCGNVKAIANNGEINKEQEVTNETEKKKQEIESGTSIMNEMPEANQGENDVKVVNLSEQAHIEICIDYSIDSYQPVQDFGFALFKENMNETNPVLSPVSAYIALTMAGNGAEGNTRQQF